MLDRPQWLLIHGGSHGAWCWGVVLDRAAAAGVSATALDLPGCGADKTPRAELTLERSVDAVLTQIDAMDSGPITVVGHSIGGWLLPYAAALRPARVAGMIFIAASVLRRGECGIDLTPNDRRPAYHTLADSSADNSLMIPFDEAWRRFFNDLEEPDARAAYSRLTPQPFGPYLSPAGVGIDDVSIPRSYIAMSRDRNYPEPVTARFAAKAGADREWVDSDHCPMVSHPAEMVDAMTRATDQW